MWDISRNRLDPLFVAVANSKIDDIVVRFWLSLLLV
ncbi:MAG: hypothetical protein UZ09_BCD002000611 [Bacteroidetes bacterium OLB9]|nr:MAG: hypothetical protein UZ09_BCD002000611 [Bacteroidetes bacterium OLB9]